MNLPGVAGVHQTSTTSVDPHEQLPQVQLVASGLDLGRTATHQDR